MRPAIKQENRVSELVSNYLASGGKIPHYDTENNMVGVTTAKGYRKEFVQAGTLPQSRGVPNPAK